MAMKNKQLEKRMARQERNVEALLELAADNEVKISHLTDDVQSLAASMKGLGETVRLLGRGVASTQRQIQTTQNQLQGLIKTVDRFVRGRNINGRGRK
jgi:uncharacterized coiled-coil protein SlyX